MFFGENVIRCSDEIEFDQFTADSSFVFVEKLMEFSPCANTAGIKLRRQYIMMSLFTELQSYKLVKTNQVHCHCDLGSCHWTGLLFSGKSSLGFFMKQRKCCRSVAWGMAVPLREHFGCDGFALTETKYNHAVDCVFSNVLTALGL